MTRRRMIKVAVVEDDAYYNKLMTRYVQRICHNELFPTFDFQVKSYYSAHDSMAELTPDLDFLILDYYLDTHSDPEVLTAEDVIGRVRRFCPDCKIIVVSGLSDESRIQRVVDMGIYEYINKNAITADHVQSILRQVILNEAAWLTRDSSHPAKSRNKRNN